ncbi:CBS domain-containing protein [Streptomyces sp. NBC_01476]|uniref:CBS domain-containing protein n=1 Tax=Streptomyces sp. NBC_01476 TaxID=2903881 RepID=UPI002E2FBB78|nr:CBS domain-containing protein [Streptomyces sp. NBC_01476]
MRQHRNVSDLMTTSVVRVRPETGYKDIAGILSDYDISAVPVVDADDRPLGVVSEADLMRKESAHPDPEGLLAAARPSERTRARATATDAAGLMTSPAVVAHPDWTVVEAARVMEEHHVKRLPVVDGIGTLVGIVSRADLLRLFLRKDHAIREEIAGDVLDRTLRISPTEVDVEVADGRVTLHGTVERRSLIPMAKRLCEGVDGVVDVTEDLDYRTADAAPSPERAARR